MDDRRIRFIDSKYNELFTIPDGGSIVIKHPNGEEYVGECKYIDEAHFAIRGSCYHICQFAESQERSGATVEIEKEPEMVGGYRITHRVPVGNKVYMMGHNPNAASPYATWQAYRDKPGKDWGHYWTSKSIAFDDLHCRAEAERTGKPYDHTQKHGQKNREDTR